MKFKSGLQASQPFCCNYDEGVLAASSFVFLFSTGSAVGDFPSTVIHVHLYYRAAFNKAFKSRRTNTSMDAV